ncbi:sodium:proline symporter [Blastopirellula marina]|uniref:Sodium:proline symporter n=1 Tax=Blastopirellula marina TaxID=124 RepID=A0A2S8G3M3_9BACT|nr:MULTISPECIES: sodium:solute symporter family protein [Pirellulaceae]PQO39037.1 sodium:proline symporter [Blastopirellula marina]RCS55345.1 sodium:solute symporter family protein [Bremerella cremea]
MVPLIVICVYLVLLLALGIFASTLFRGSSQDYMLASHSIGPFLLLMSLFGTTMTAFALVGSTGEAYAEGVGVYGLLASSSGIIHSLCFFVLGIKLWSLGKKYGYTTQIQFFRDRLQSDKIGILLFPILVGLVIPYLLIGVMASGTVVSAVSEGAFSNMFAEYDYGVPNWLGSLVISIVVLIYVFFGGMRGTAWANAFQTIVFMILGIITFWVISDNLGGVKAASEAVEKRNPSKLMRSVAESDEQKYEKAFATWQSLAEYNYANKKANGELLTPEQKAKAIADYKGPPIGNWKARAEANVAVANNLLNLSVAEKNDAFMEQDDRVMPKQKPQWWDKEVMTGHELNEYQRNEDAVLAAYTDPIYNKNMGHPNDLINPDKPELGTKWTRKRTAGVYRATKWSPEEPRAMSMLVFITYMFIPLSVGMFPHLFQHWLTAKNAQSFKLPVVAHPIFIAIVWIPCVLVGVWATSAVVPGTERALIPPHFNTNAVLPFMVANMSGPFLSGLLTAGVLAAIMSSLDSQFLCIGTMFTEDIVVHYGGKKRFTDKQVLIIARCFIIAIVAITYILSLYEPRRVFTLGVWTFSGFSSLFPLVFAALYWKRLTKAGAYACVITAIGLWCLFFYMSDMALNPHFTVFGMMPVATMVPAAAIAMIVVSLMTQPPSEEHLARFFPQKKA